MAIAEGVKVNTFADSIPKHVGAPATKSITAVDGSVLDLIHVKAVSQQTASDLAHDLGDDLKKLWFGQYLYTLDILRDSDFNVWFIQKRGEKHYIGVCISTIDDCQEHVSMLVAVTKKWRGNGYGRAAIITMAEAYGELATEPVFEVVAGMHDNFCINLGMKLRHGVWRLPISELIAPATQP